MNTVRTPRRNRRANRRRNPNRPYKPQSLYNMLLSLPTRDQAGVVTGPFPNCMEVECVTRFSQIVQGASSFLVTPEFRLNDVFLPYTGSPISASGLAGAAGIYDSYHVNSVTFEVDVVSNDGFPMSFGLFLRDTQPSTLITTYNLAKAAIGNGPVIAAGTVSSTAGVSKYRLPRPVKCDISRIVGRPMVYMCDLLYDAPVTTNPTQVVWASFILISPSAIINLVNGCNVTITMRQHTCFYSKKVVL